MKMIKQFKTLILFQNLNKKKIQKTLKFNLDIIQI